MSSYAARTREMFRKYGKVAVGVHFAVYFSGLGACYVAVERGVKVDKFLRGWGLMGEKKVEERKVEREEAGGPAAAAAAAAAELPREAAAGAGAATASPSGQHRHPEDDAADDDDRNWLARALSGRGSSLALAFVANKALFPVRAPITLGLTPVVARALRVNAARSASAAASSSSSSSSSSASGKSGDRSGGGGSGGSGGGGGSAP